MRHLVNVENEKIENRKVKLGLAKCNDKNEDISQANVKDVKGLHLLTRDEEQAAMKRRIAKNQKGAQNLLSEH